MYGGVLKNNSPQVSNMLGRPLITTHGIVFLFFNLKKKEKVGMFLLRKFSDNNSFHKPSDGIINSLFLVSVFTSDSLMKDNDL